RGGCDYPAGYPGSGGEGTLPRRLESPALLYARRAAAARVSSISDRKRRAEQSARRRSHSTPLICPAGTTRVFRVTRVPNCRTDQFSEQRVTDSPRPLPCTRPAGLLHATSKDVATVGISAPGRFGAWAAGRTTGLQGPL